MASAIAGRRIGGKARNKDRSVAPWLNILRLPPTMVANPSHPLPIPDFMSAADENRYTDAESFADFEEFVSTLPVPEWS